MGSVYTREELKTLLDTQDATINTGVFRPAGFSSVLIFVTKNKTSDRTQYEDRLVGDTLHWQGQTSGRTDSMIVEHRRQGLELLIFYRDRKYEHPGAGFRYEGAFEYVSHTPGQPSDFVLRREQPSSLDQATADAESSGDFDPTTIDDARRKTLAAIVRRLGQPAFRRALLKAYNGRCAVSGCTLTEVLEAAHILPYKGPGTNHVTNGLLLRTDLHTLFDLGLIAVHERHNTLIVSPNLRGTEYEQLEGTVLYLPQSASERPNAEALRMHREGASL
jgi:hypothetical protein